MTMIIQLRGVNQPVHLELVHWGLLDYRMTNAVFL